MSQEKVKRKIVSEVSKRTLLSKDVVNDVINEYLKVLREEIIETGKLTVRGLFSISTYTKKSHSRRNINTGETTQYPETDFLRVSLSKPLRDEFQEKRRNGKSSYSFIETNEEADDFDAELEDLFTDEI